MKASEPRAGPHETIRQGGARNDSPPKRTSPATSPFTMPYCVFTVSFQGTETAQETSATHRPTERAFMDEMVGSKTHRGNSLILSNSLKTTKHDHNMLSVC